MALGNFTAVDGQARDRPSGSTSPRPTRATLSPWHAPRFDVPCPVPNFSRGVDFSPDGSYFVIVTTGGTNGTVGLCDAAARFETSDVELHRRADLDQLDRGRQPVQRRGDRRGRVRRRAPALARQPRGPQLRGTRRRLPARHRRDRSRRRHRPLVEPHEDPRRTAPRSCTSPPRASGSAATEAPSRARTVRASRSAPPRSSASSSSHTPSVRSPAMAERRAGGGSRPRSGRWLLLVQVGQFALAGLIALAIVGLATAVASRRIGEREAVSDARTTTVTKAQGLVEPAIDEALLDGDPDAVAGLDAVVRRTCSTRTWSGSSCGPRTAAIIYSDEPRLIGSSSISARTSVEAIDSGPDRSRGERSRRAGEPLRAVEGREAARGLPAGALADRESPSCSRPTSATTR